jgi:hypothetical protein
MLIADFETQEACESAYFKVTTSCDHFQRSVVMYACQGNY